MRPVLSKIAKKANAIVRDNARLKALVSKANEKLGTVAEKDESRNELLNGVQMVIRMLRMQIKGEYRAFSAKSIFLLAFALLYFVIPTDLIPDFIPTLGFTDDISVIYYVINSLADDIALFKEWESADQ